ncbi:MAG: non-ribosomal peptide synthetase [Porticoccaceae bacterium]
MILPTSGTTARPKIVPLSHANLVASVRSIIQHFGLSSADRCLNVRPLFHGNGLISTLLATISSGGSVVCMPGLDGDAFFDWVAQYQPTWYSLVPAMHQWVIAHGALYRQKAPNHRFRFLRSGAAPLAPTTLHSLEALMGAPVIEAYGMTERTPIAINPLPPALRKAGSVGLPAGVEIRLLDAAGQQMPAGALGEIAIRGPGVTAGYENNPDANASAFTDGWFRTGDQGCFDDDGYLFITGRIKEIVNRGGQKISPREVEEALLEHPDVLQAVAFAAPHPTLGEDLIAAVVPRGEAKADENDLRNFLFSRLTEFKVPSAIIFVDAFPVGATGKVQRISLFEQLGHLLKRDFVAPRSDVERSLAVIFSQILGCDVVGVDDNFFSLGGDSLSGARVMARINDQQGIALPVPTLFSHPTITDLAVKVEEAKAKANDLDKALEWEIAQMSDEEVARELAKADDAAL